MYFNYLFAHFESEKIGIGNPSGNLYKDYSALFYFLCRWMSFIYERAQLSMFYNIW